MMKLSLGISAAVILTCAIGVAGAGEMIVVEKGVSRTPIFVADGAGPETQQAVKELAEYVKKISGASPEVIVGFPSPAPASAIWIGAQPELASLFPGVSFELKHPEEIMCVCNGKHLAILGRDRTYGGKQVEFGTVNAIYTFIEKRLGVRWLWPGPLGEDIIKQDTIAFAPFEYRFHPVFLKRHLWPRSPRDWHLHQRHLLYSFNCNNGHAFTDWWDKYHEAHPEYFAMQPNGTRAPPGPPRDVKLCLSNPGVWKQWLDNAEEAIRKDPSITVVSATPNDGPWHCVCEKCRAWDDPNGPKIGSYVSLTDRHVKFWNILALGLRERFPDREVLVGALAYGHYITPPVSTKLEKNVTISHVGFFPMTSDAERERQKLQWKEWADKASIMLYRPNLWYWGGGVWGLPEVAMKRAMEDIRFLADNKCVGVTVDVLRHHWATQGPQYYLMAQLIYDPYADGAAIMRDYYRRGFGPAAEEIEAYWDLMEDARLAVVSSPDFKMGSANRYSLPPLFASVYTKAFFDRAEAAMKKAEAKVAQGHDVYQKRVAFTRAGLDVSRLLMETVPLMTRLREGGGRDAEAAKLATANWDAIEKTVKNAPPYAISFQGLCTAIRGKGYMGVMQDYFGPPSEEMLRAAQAKPVIYAPAKWKLAFSDDFKRTELGRDWKVLKGSWKVENGWLTSSGGSIVITKNLPGLQKVEFKAVGTGNPELSDMSPFIHAGPAGPSSGYLLQFGGYNNQRTAIQRLGKAMKERTDIVITPGKVHTIVAEYDGKAARLTVDGKVALEAAESQPLLGREHEQIGFYVHEGAIRISEIKVFTSKAVEDTTVLEGEGYD